MQNGLKELQVIRVCDSHFDAIILFKAPWRVGNRGDLGGGRKVGFGGIVHGAPGAIHNLLLRNGSADVGLSSRDRRLLVSSSN